MTIKQASAKINNRLNKSASGDYDNIWNYTKTEAYNKAVIDVVREALKGTNRLQEGDEETSFRVDDLQFLLKTEKLNVRDKGNYTQTSRLPTDYAYFKRLTPLVSKGRCSGVEIRSHFREEANVDILRHIPSFSFEETFHTLINNKAHVYHNKDFSIDSVILTYYRKPKVYDFTKLNDEIEFSEPMAEIILDEAVKILASDMESLNQKSLAQERKESNI